MGLLKTVKAQIGRDGSGRRDRSPDGNKTHPSSNGGGSQLSTKRGQLQIKSGDTFNHRRYTVEKLLGSGSYSQVWRARDTRANTMVAIKFLSNDFYNGGSELWEIEIMTRLREIAQASAHPGRSHVIHMLDHFEHSGTPRPHVCIVLELLGASIEDEMLASNRPRLPYQQTKSIARQLLQALDFVHSECRVLHTDITVDNVMMVPNESGMCLSIYDTENVAVRLGDFGTACWVERHLSDHVQRPLFRAPEVTLKSLYDTSADIFDLGCFTYQIVTGTAPFAGSHGRDVTSVLGEQDRLAQLTQLFGPVPDVVLDDAMRRTDFYDRGGALRQPVVAQRHRPETQLNDLVHGQVRMSSLRKEATTHDVSVFCDFLRCALATDPRQRWTARALLQHPWLDDGRTT